MDEHRHHVADQHEFDDDKKKSDGSLAHRELEIFNFRVASETKYYHVRRVHQVDGHNSQVVVEVLRYYCDHQERQSPQNEEVLEYIPDFVEYQYQLPEATLKPPQNNNNQDCKGQHLKAQHSVDAQDFVSV